jgi:hypothetical protein
VVLEGQELRPSLLAMAARVVVAVVAVRQAAAAAALAQRTLSRVREVAPVRQAMTMERSPTPFQI